MDIGAAFIECIDADNEAIFAKDIYTAHLCGVKLYLYFNLILFIDIIIYCIEYYWYIIF